MEVNQEETTYDVDLYSDFLAGESCETNDESEKDRALKELQEKYEESEKLCEELKDKNEYLEKKNETLVVNLTKLFKTARKEIYMKNKELKKMRERLDNIIFRRASKQDLYLNSPSNRQINTSPPQTKINDEGKTSKIIDNNNNNNSRNITIFKPNGSFNDDSKHLLNYYSQANHKKVVKKSKNFDKTTKINKLNVDVDTTKFSRDEEYDRKRKISVKSPPKKKFPRIETREVKKDDTCCKILRKAGENKDVEDGEILSDSEISASKDRDRRNSNLIPDRRRSSSNKSTNCKSEYLTQLEVNRMKMQVRREKILLVKAKEDRKFCNFKSESQRRVCR